MQFYILPVNATFNIMVTLGTPDQGTCYQVSQIIGVLKAPDRTFMYLGYQRGGEMCLLWNGASMGHPLKCDGT